MMETLLEVGVKYCGGCNPGYDRIKLFKKIFDEIGEGFVFHTAEDNVTYDFLLIISGCPNSCPNSRSIKAKYGFFSLKSEKDYKKSIKIMRNTMQSQ